MPLEGTNTTLQEKVLDNLRNVQGLENPEQYITNASFVAARLSADIDVNDFDVVVCLPNFNPCARVFPRFVSAAIAAALRETWPNYPHQIRSVHLAGLTMSGQFLVFESDPSHRLPPGLNNCFFKEAETISHDELRFRSKAEIAIYDELKKRNGVLFFPCPAAVFGAADIDIGFGAADIDIGEKKKREPDFLVCYKGHWGILEVNGDNWHSGVVATAKDHERAREFQQCGLFFVNSFSADRCRNDPKGVVDEFLTLLQKHPI